MRREIERYPAYPMFNKALIQLLGKLCFFSSPLKRADLIFIFGTNIIHEVLAKRIEKLIDENYSEKIMITGGIANYSLSAYSNLPESEMIRSYINPDKLKKIALFIETTSKNNLENVSNASRMLDFSEVKSLICLSHSYASRRSAQTLKTIFSGKIISYPYDVPSETPGIDITQENWWLSERGKSLVWGEFLRISKYGLRGDFPMTKEMKEVVARIDNLLASNQ